MQQNILQEKKNQLTVMLWKRGTSFGWLFICLLIYVWLI